MDLICTRCGEPWDVYHVLHEEPEEFDRQGGLIRACPCCHGKEPEDMTDETRRRLRAVAEVAEVLGDDVDGLAALIDDLDALEL
jgi:hypothetical protein